MCMCKLMRKKKAAFQVSTLYVSEVSEETYFSMESFLVWFFRYASSFHTASLSSCLSCHGSARWILPPGLDINSAFQWDKIYMEMSCIVLSKILGLVAILHWETCSNDSVCQMAIHLTQHKIVSVEARMFLSHDSHTTSSFKQLFCIILADMHIYVLYSYYSTTDLI